MAGVADDIYLAIERAADNRRSARLGASQAGHPCARKQWLEFRWALREKFDGRMLRLFRRGHLEEEQLVNDLRAAGYTVSAEDPGTREQHFVTAVDGHAVMKMDGLVKLPNGGSWILLELKTANDRSFKDLEKKGVEKSKPEHYAQMQLGMLWSRAGGAGLDEALYISVKKSDDTLHSEFVPFDEEKAAAIHARVEEAITSERLPERIAGDPSDMNCRWCKFRPLCFEEQLPEVSCRSCWNAACAEKGEWFCTLKQRGLSMDDQAAGCLSHRYHPTATPEHWGVLAEDREANSITYKLPDGRQFKNGERAPGSYLSGELYALAGNMEVIGDPDVDALRVQFSGSLEKPSNKPSDEPFFDDEIPF